MRHCEACNVVGFIGGTACACVGIVLALAVVACGYGGLACGFFGVDGGIGGSFGGWSRRSFWLRLGRRGRCGSCGNAVALELNDAGLREGAFWLHWVHVVIVVREGAAGAGSV